MIAVREDQHGTMTGYVYGCRCAACRDAGAEYSRKYRSEHPEEIAERKRKYHAAHSQELTERKREYRVEHPKARVEHDRKYRAVHSAEKAECDRKYRAEHPSKTSAEQRRRIGLRYKYGLEVSEWEAILSSQGGCCKICGADVPGGKNGWHTDHDHETGTVRGILCNGCNTGLGRFRDDPKLLRAAIQYLEVATP